MPQYGSLKIDSFLYNDSGTDVTLNLNGIAPKANPTFTGVVTVPTAAASDNTTKAASTAFVHAYYASKSGATFTGALSGTDLTLSGNLVVNGTTTTVNTENLEVKDKNIIVGKVTTPSDATADGGGITLLGSSNKTFNWVNATDAWTSSEHIYLGDNKKLLLGTGAGGVQDLQIYSNGTEGILETQDGGTIKIKDGNNTMATFSGASNQIDIHVQTVFIGASSNASWDKANNRFIGTITEINVTANNSTDETVYPLFVDGATGSQGAETDTGLTYNPSSGLLTSTSFAGALTGNVNGNCSGTSGGFTAGNATNLDSGTVPTGRLGSGAANSGTFLAGNSTWQAISSAPEVTGTASGSIAANTGVQVNSNGTLSQPAAISEANGAETSSSSSYPSSGNQWGQAYDSDAEKVIQFYHRPYNSNANLDNLGYIRIGTVSGTSISWGSTTDFGTTHCEETKVIFHPPTGKVVATWAQGLPATGGTSSGTVYWRVGTISGTSVTWGSPVSTGVSTGDYNYARMFWNPDDPTKIGLGYRASNMLRLRHCTVSTTSNTCTDNGLTATIGASGASEWDILCAEGQMFAAMQSGGSSYTINVIGLSSDYQQNWSYMSAPASNQRYGSPRLAYDKANNKLVVMGWKNNNTTIAYHASVTSSGNTTAFSWGSEEQVDPGYSGAIACDYCPKAEKYIFFTGNNASDSIESRTAVISGTGFSFDTQVTHRSGQGSRKERAVNARNDSNGGSSNGKYIVSCIFESGSGHDDTIRTITKQLPSTTRDANKYLGISKASYSNGQTATVKVVGNTADGSSLTPNTTYYIQDNGTIGSTVTDVTVGKAFSTTKILIKN